MMRSLWFLFVVSCYSNAAAYMPAPVVHTMVGAVAGSAGAIAAYPIDFVKSQLQTETGRAKYAGGFEAAMDIVKSAGTPLALYRGVMVNVIGVAPEKTIKLGANDWVRVLVRSQLGYLPLYGEVIAGGVAGMTQVIVTNPLEVLKVKIQTSNSSFKEVMSEFTGVMDLYQGAGACVARDMVFSAVLFPVYAHGKTALAAALISMLGAGAGAATFWANLLAGSFAAAPAAIISTPADVIKTRIQQSREEGEEKLTTPAVGEDQSFLEVGADILRNEGPAVLFSGWFERVVRSVPQFGVTLAVFDTLNTMAVDHGWMLEKVG